MRGLQNSGIVVAFAQGKRCHQQTERITHRQNGLAKLPEQNQRYTLKVFVRLKDFIIVSRESMQVDRLN